MPLEPEWMQKLQKESSGMAIRGFFFFFSPPPPPPPPPYSTVHVQCEKKKKELADQIGNACAFRSFIRSFVPSLLPPFSILFHFKSIWGFFCLLASVWLAQVLFISRSVSQSVSQSLPRRRPSSSSLEKQVRRDSIKISDFRIGIQLPSLSDYLPYSFFSLFHDLDAATAAAERVAKRGRRKLRNGTLRHQRSPLLSFSLSGEPLVLVYKHISSWLSFVSTAFSSSSSGCYVHTHTHTVQRKNRQPPLSFSAAWQCWFIPITNEMTLCPIYVLTTTTTATTDPLHSPLLIPVCSFHIQISISKQEKRLF